VNTRSESQCCRQESPTRSFASTMTEGATVPGQVVAHGQTGVARTMMTVSIRSGGPLIAPV
jgi:hypothetical protein